MPPHAVKPSAKSSANSGPAPAKVKDKEPEVNLLKAPENQAQVLAQVSLDGLPCPSADVEEAIVQLLNVKYDTVAQIFAHYCRASECTTVQTATTLRLGALRS